VEVRLRESGAPREGALADFTGLHCLPGRSYDPAEQIRNGNP